jgi:enoyl-[acyl-carrier protein] reductase III
VRSAESASGLQESAVAEGLAIDTVKADVSSDKGREQLVAEIARRQAPLHAIVFGAATGVHRDLAQASGRHFDFVFALNVRAFMLLVQGLLPQLAAGGSIIALSSEGAERVMPHYGLVSASKAALEALCRQWAVELAPQGIRANIVSPGAVRTEAWKVLPGGEARLAAAEAGTPGGKLVTDEAVARLVQFLASPASAGISGQTIVIDAGARVVGSG